MSEIEVTTAAEKSPTDLLLDQFVDSLTPGHHRSMGAPQTSCEVTFAALREAGRALLNRQAAAAAATVKIAPADMTVHVDHSTFAIGARETAPAAPPKPPADPPAPTTPAAPDSA